MPDYYIPFLESLSISDLRDALIHHFGNNNIEDIEAPELSQEMRKLFRQMAVFFLACVSTTSFIIANIW